MTKGQYRQTTPDAINACLSKGGEIKRCAAGQTTPRELIKPKINNSGNNIKFTTTANAA